MVVRVSYVPNYLAETQRFWVNVLNREGNVIASARAADPSERDATRYFELPISLSRSAHQIVYGLSSDGESGLWVESLELAPVGDPPAELVVANR